MNCPACGTTASDQARFCSSCGRPMHPAGDERRVVTVLFGDLVGFTTMSELLDPEQVKALVDRCFERLAADITAFGGQVDKIIGDAIVALFGAPVAHEDDAERAVRAALRMQQSLAVFGAEAGGRHVQMRIGVNTGEVLVGALRAGGDYTAMGDVVNIASRLQTNAAAGEVLVGPATHAATSAVIGYEPRGALTARGREETVEAWSAVEPILPPGYRARRLDVPLVGREDELALLHQALATSVGHHRAHLTLLVGEPGMGKTRLAEEVGHWAELSQGARVLEGRCLPYGEANVWWPVAEALRQSCGVKPTALEHEALELTQEAVALTYGMASTDAEVARVTAGLMTLMGYAGPREIDPTNLREESVRSLVGFIEASTRQRPSVILLSDLHWADDVVLELIDTLLERLHRYPLVLVATARPTLTERWTPRPGRHDVLMLNIDPLDEKASTDLVHALLGEVPSPELEQALIRRGGGNPFFLEELVSLLDTGRVAELPDTLRGLVAARLDALAPDERAVLQDAAVIGRRAPVDALRSMADELGRTCDVNAVVDALVEKDVLVVENGSWSFRSDLVREVTYSTITKFDRAQRHTGIAAFLEGRLSEADEHIPDHTLNQLAHHHAVAAELASELGALHLFPAGFRDRAVEWIERAADRAFASKVLALAAKLYTQAITLHGIEPSATRLRLLLGRASARTEAWELSGARADVDEAAAEAELVGDPHCGAQSLLVLGEVERKAGNGAAAVDILERAARAFTELDDDGGRAEANRQIGMVELFRGRFVEAERSVTAALEGFRSLKQLRGEAWALQNLAWIAFVTGRTDEAEARLHESVSLFSDTGDTTGMAWALGLFSFVRLQQGRPEEAEALAVQILHEARTGGDRWATGMMLELLASVRLWSGQTDEATQLATESLEAFISTGDPYGLAQAGSMLGRSLVMGGRVDEGFFALADAYQIAERSGSGGTSIAVSSAIGTAVQVGEPERLVLLLEALAVRADDIADTAAASPDHIDLSVALAMAALQQGNLALVVERAERLAALQESAGSEPYVMAARALAAAATGASTRAIEMAHQVVDARFATYLDRVTASLAAAMASARASDKVASRRWLGTALATVDATGDRVAQAVVRLAEAFVLDHFDDREADAAHATARARLDALGIAATGWSTAFTLILTPTDRVAV